MIFFDKLLDELAKIPDIENKVISDLISGMAKQERYLRTPTRPSQKKHENPYVENFEWLFDLHK